MKKICLNFLFVTFLIIQNNYSQNFKEISSFHENGNPKDITYKNEDLKIVKTQVFDINNKLISDYNYNPQTGKKNGEFFDTVNKGFYKEGVLTCMDCTLNFGENRVGTQIKGNIIDGRPIGKIKVYTVQEISKNQYDPYTSYILSLEFGERINYSSYVGTGLYQTTFMLDLNYNDGGNIDGKHQLNNLTTVYFNDGVIDGLVRNSDKNFNIIRDSIFDKNKIWKIEGTYQKNNGLPRFRFDEFNSPWEISFDVSGNNKEYYSDNTIFIKNKKEGLNELGIYDKVIDDDFYKIFSYLSKQLVFIQKNNYYNYTPLKEELSKYYMYDDIHLNMLGNQLQSPYFFILDSYKDQNNPKMEYYITKLPVSWGNDGYLDSFISLQNVVKLYKDGLKDNSTSKTQIYFWDDEDGDYILFDIKVLEKEIERINKFINNESVDTRLKSKIEKPIREEVEFYTQRVKEYFESRYYYSTLMDEVEVEEIPENIKEKMIEKGGVDEYYSYFLNKEILKGLGFRFLDGYDKEKGSSSFRELSTKFQDDFKREYNFWNRLNRSRGGDYKFFSSFIKLNKISLMLNDDKDDYSHFVISGTINSKPTQPSRYSDYDEEIYDIYKNLYKNGKSKFKIIFYLKDYKCFLTDENLKILMEL